MLHVTIVLYQRGKRKTAYKSVMCVCCKMKSRDFAMSAFLHEIKYIQTRLSNYQFCSMRVMFAVGKSHLKTVPAYHSGGDTVQTKLPR